MRTRFPALGAAGALLAAGLASTAMAAPVELNGYFRSSGGSSGDGGQQICFRLPGAAVWFRLGNECDLYAGLTLTTDLGKVDGTNFKGHFTLAQGTQQLGNWEPTTPSFREAYVEAIDFGAAMNMPALKGSTLWMGKRFNQNEDIHMLDYAYLDSGFGSGAGLNDVNVGFGKFSYGYLRTGEANYNATAGDNGFSPAIVDGGATSVTTHAFRLREVGVNPGGNLGLTLALVRANNRAAVAGGPDREGKNGVSLALTHQQDDLFGLGGFNKAGIQYVTGAAGLQLSALPGFTANGHKGYLLFDHWVVEPKGVPFTASMVAGYRDERLDQTGSTAQSHYKEFFIGARPQYHLNNIWSLMSEVGYQEVKPQDAGVSGDTRKLLKLTVGTQFSMGSSIWSRPALRFFATYAKWNDAAAAAGVADAAGLGGNPLNGANRGPVCTGRDCNTYVPAYDNKRNALGYGVQVEAWF
jgi:maltoporin